jgi:hypothetical protein
VEAERIRTNAEVEAARDREQVAQIYNGNPPSTAAALTANTNQV